MVDLDIDDYRRLCRADRGELRPDDQVRHRHPSRDGLGQGDSPPLHPQIHPSRLPDLQREIEEGLNVVESWNRVNAVIFFGKSGEFATNRRDQQDLGMVALHILQAAIVYVNTLMVQEILALPEWEGMLTVDDRRGLTPLLWSRILAYGEVRLNMARRLALGSPTPPALDEDAFVGPLLVGWRQLP